jgi:hypothetical protein
MESKGVFKPKDGQYYYARHRGLWGIWLHHEFVDGSSTGDFVKDCMTKMEAMKEVAKLNKWCI